MQIDVRAGENNLLPQLFAEITYCSVSEKC